MANAALAGHKLLMEGDNTKDAEGRQVGQRAVSCTCGAQGPVGATIREAKEWHRDHKEQVRSEG